MKKEFSLSIKTLVYISIIILFIGIGLMSSGILIYNYSKLNDNTIAALIAFLGNILGGLIGGVVAYTVAAIQVRSTIAYDGQNRVSSSYSLLRLIKAELNNNKNIIGSLKEQFSRGENLPLLKNISISNWERCSKNLGIEVKDETIEKMTECYLKLEALKMQESSVKITNSDVVLNSINELLILIQKDIDEMTKQN